MKEYLGTVFGELRIPCHAYVEGFFDFEDVECLYDPSTLMLPADIDTFKTQLVEKKKNEAEARGAPFFDGQMVRLNDYGVKIKDLKTEDQKLVLTLSRTSWFTYSSTNKSLDEKILEEQGRKFSVREKYVTDSLNLSDVLANPIGCSATVISEPDHSLMMTERSMKLAQYPGLYGDYAAGFMNPDKDLVDGKPNPFKTLEREAKKEAGIDFSVNDLKLLGVGRAMDDLHGEIWGELRSSLTVQEILSLPVRDKYENLRRFSVPFEPKDVLKYVATTIDSTPIGVPPASGAWVIGKSPKWVPAHALNTIRSLEREYGHDKLIKELEKC